MHHLTRLQMMFGIGPTVPTDVRELKPASEVVANAFPEDSPALRWTETLLQFDLASYHGPLCGLPLDILSDMTAELSFLIGASLFVLNDDYYSNCGLIMFIVASLQLAFTDAIRFVRAVVNRGGVFLSFCWFIASAGAIGFVIFCILLYDKYPPQTDPFHLGLFISCLCFQARSLGLTLVGWNRKGSKFYFEMPAGILEVVGTTCFTFGSWYIWCAYDNIENRTDEEWDHFGRQLFVVGSLLGFIAISLITLAIVLSNRSFRIINASSESNPVLSTPSSPTSSSSTSGTRGKKIDTSVIDVNTQ